MIFLRTTSSHPDFQDLIKQLDADLAITDGEDHAFYSQFNKVDAIKHVVVGYLDNNAVACGAIKEFDEISVEVKRMFVAHSHRNKGFASQILVELENWAKDLGYGRCVLETGKRQKDAIALYLKNNYLMTPNYGQYVGIENSQCFEKIM